MFYQIESLRKGGRFYLCWLADSWPTRFATISRRQLWSYDIRKICDNLLEVVRNESGRPTKRFSLRLSAKLLRGLVRIYKRKVDSLLSDMIMMSLIVMKKSKKTRNINVAETMEDEEVRRPQLQQLEIQETVEEAPVNEQGIEEILQQNGNMVSNIGDITLKEATIPEVLVPPNDSSDDIIFIRVPAETYFRRPCHGGEKLLSNFGFPISRLFSRNLGVISDRQVEESAEAIRQQSPRTLTKSVLENIEEQEAPSVEDRPKVQIEPLSLEANYTMTEMLNVSEPRRVSADKDLDIADMLTQKVETLSQARRRKAVPEIVIESPKRQRSVGYMSSRGSQLAKEQSVFITDVQADKENVPANIQQPQDAELILSAMRQQAGQQEVEAHSETQRSLPATRKTESDRSETPLGSLDRTKVSLGDSDETTDSKRFLHDQWGTEATMVKILKQIKAGLQPVNVASLLDKGLVIPGYTRIIAARCFVSILNLKKNGYISVKKNPDTLEIADISIGPTLISLKKL